MKPSILFIESSAWRVRLQVSTFFFFFKYLSSEGGDFRTFHFPGIRRQTGLAAGLAKECFSIPAVLGGHLGQQQTLVRSSSDYQTVSSHLNRIYIGHFIYGRKYRDFNLQFIKLINSYRVEPGVALGGGNCHTPYCFRQWLFCIYPAYAPAEFTSFFNGNKSPSFLRQNRGIGPWLWSLFAVYYFHNGLASQLKQVFFFFCGKSHRPPCV